MTAELLSSGVAERLLAEFAVASEPGNERTALGRVADAVAGQGLTEDQVARLKTAVGEATMNAIEHGNGNRPELDVDLRVLAGESGVAVTITDSGGNDHPATGPVAVPDLDLKLAGLQSPRGWGLFLIKNMVDAMGVSTDGSQHTVCLVMYADSADAAREGVDTDAQQV
jgi:anti-sigma regulatory factor (Ser/Thr protein kinase)